MPNREIVKINHFPTSSAITNLVKAKCILENINIDKPRGKFIVSSRITLRKTFAHSDVLSVPYIKHIEAQSNNLFWFDQIE